MSNATFHQSRSQRFVDIWIRVTHGSALVLGLAAVMHFGIVGAPRGNAQVGMRGAVVAQDNLLGASSDKSELFRIGGWAAWPGSARPALGDALAFSAPSAEDEVALSLQMQRVCEWVAKRYRVSGDELAPVLAEAESSARDAGLDPLLIVAMMAVESSFNPLAESRMGARGLMQVIPRWHMDKIAADADEDAFFDPVVNVQVGTLVLAEGLQRYGSLQEALQYYNGARNDPEARYTKKVLAVKAQLASVAGSSDDV
ncbi:MAG: transglycosylase SLT domain-containing protein [Rhodocyclales bacterium]|nr:transglycosylase SLT domain-containing protein [Rhodocyclales bacterium]